MATLSQRAERDAARRSRNDRIDEVVYLLSCLTQTADWNERAHLSPIDSPRSASTMNYVVCVHLGDERLTWRVSDFEVFEFFKHLSKSTCSRGLSRSDKMLRLRDLAAKEHKS